MRYLQALEQKGLKKEDLAKQTQKKIDEIEHRKAQIEEDADDYEEDELKEILQKIRQFDQELEKSILKFNPEIYKKRVEVFERNKKLAKGEVIEKEEEEEPKAVQVVKEQPKAQPKVEVAPQKVVEQPKKTISQNLDELESKVKTNPEKFNVEQEQTETETDDAEEVEVEEIEDFKNKGSIKPKKMSTSIILMGVGAFLLTWGAVNFFRERR